MVARRHALYRSFHLRRIDLLRLLIVAVLFVPASGRILAEDAVRIPVAARPPHIEDFLSQVPPAGWLRIDGFRQLKPGDGEPASVQTTVYLSHDDQSLYVLFVCEDEPAEIRAHRNRREQINEDDAIGIFVDTFHDGKRAYGFITNPLGVQQDIIRTDGQDDDSSFDTLWYSKGQLTDFGFVVRMEIPFKSLRFPSSETPTWGIAVGRRINRLNEESYWPYITEREEGFVRQMAVADLSTRISSGRNIQLVPYGVFADARFLNPNPPAGPAFETDRDLRAGLDAKVVVREAVTLDFTLNPDFSQVESDEPQVTVNERFEVFLPERRSFFIENAGYFQTPLNLFFSRRIAHPELGARVTGKLNSLAIGALVMDDRAPGEALAEGDPLFEDRAANGVVRIQHEFRNQSTIGVLATRRAFGPASNDVASVDARLRLTDNWIFTGQAVASRARESDHTVTGAAYYAGIQRYSRHLSWSEEYTDFGPDFVTWLGYIPRVDIRELEHRLAYQWRPEGKSVVSWGPSSEYYFIWDHSGTLQEWSMDHWLEAELRGRTELRGWRNERYVLHRGIGFRAHTQGFHFSSERIPWLLFSSEVKHGNHVNFFPAEGLNPFLSSRVSANASIAFLPTPALRVDQTYFYNRLGILHDDLEHGFTKGTPIYNNHILRTKLNYQFTRPLSLRFIFDYEGILPNTSLVDLERTKRPVLDLLMTYLLNPGTAMYIGYTERLENITLSEGPPTTLIRSSDPSMTTARQFFVKLSYLVRF